MVMTDPIADLFTRIRNAAMSRHDKVVVPYSKMKEMVANIFCAEGFAGNVVVKDDGSGFKNLCINLKYDSEDTSVINGITRVSKPGLRVYVGVKKIPLVKGGLGVAIMSTSQGVLSGRESRKRNLGGELLGVVW